MEHVVNLSKFRILVYKDSYIGDRRTFNKWGETQKCNLLGTLLFYYVR